MGCGSSASKPSQGAAAQPSETILEKPSETAFEKPSEMWKPLYVRVEKAKDLRDADSLLNGTSDPYVIVRIGAKGTSWAEKFDDVAERQWRSDSKEDSTNPAWNLAFSLDSAVIEAALRTLSDDDWELHLRVYDSDLVGEDYLGEAIVAIPSGPEEQEFVQPLAGTSGQRGNVTIQFAFSDADWVTPELRASAAVVNGKMFGGAGEGMLFSKMINSVCVKWENFMSRLAGIFNNDASTITPHNLEYVADMASFGLVGSSYSEFLYGRSQDGGETVKDFPGPGCDTVIAHALVLEGLQNVCAKLDSKEVTRSGPDGFLGLLRLNGAWWARDAHEARTAVEPPCIALATSTEQHTRFRPIVEQYMALQDGDGKKAAIAQSAREWIDSRHAHGAFQVRQHVKEWGIKVLHSMLLDISLSDAELSEFVNQQSKVTILSIAIPTPATDAVAPFLGLEGLLQFRKQYLERYTAILREKHSNLNEVDLTYLASAILDAMLFAGGASVSLAISCALATVYADSSPLARADVPARDAKDEQFAKQVTWECIRYFPPVVGFPWTTPGGSHATNAEATHRTCLALAAAMKDPRVWGSDAEEFKLRPLAEYHNLSVAFAEQAVAAPDLMVCSRNCPGKSLALACITEFLKQWFVSEGKWTLPPEEQAKIDFSGSPTQKPGGFEFKPA